MTVAVLELLALCAGAMPVEVGQWTIHSDRGHDEVLERVRELLPRAQLELEGQLGLALRGQAAVVLCGSAAGFRRATPGIDHRHTLGVAFPEQKVVYLNCEAIENEPYESFAITLRHEVSHLLVGEVVRRGHRRVPLWFDEGVAVWTSGKVPLYDQRAFERAVAAGTLPPLADLADRFPLQPTERGIAYEQSESVVRFLVRRHGQGVIPRILQAAGRGVGFETAVQEATATDLATLEQRWLAAIQPRWRIVSWVVNAFTLFGLMSLLAVFAFWVYWRRRRRKYQEWDMEDSFYGNGGNPWR